MKADRSEIEESTQDADKSEINLHKRRQLRNKSSLKHFFETESKVANSSRCSKAYAEARDKKKHI